MAKKWIKRVLIFLVLLLVFHVVISFIYPGVAKLKKQNPRTTAFMEYRQDEWRKQGRSIKIRQYWVPLSRISPYAVKAAIIAEDDKFWSHEGFDFVAMQKALEKDLKKRKLKAGGSTISQQLAKNLYLSPSKNPIRKLREAIFTWRIERNLSKRRIIELYLNVAEWGEGIFGIEAAARHYFEKGAVSLTAQEAARLAAVLPNPRRFNPTGSGRFVTGRAERIYQIMVRRGIAIPEYEELMAEPAEPIVIDAPAIVDVPEPGADQGEGGSATVPDKPAVGERPNDKANTGE
jgi:monofunctional biosynthetic peptidoglycan transglycosylase